jgi:hypothetical protein
VRTIKLPASTPDTFDRALAKAQTEIAGAEARAAVHGGEWMVLEGLARRYATRARLTGLFDDYARAQATWTGRSRSPGPGPGRT